jgi:hypothetical protein
VYNLISGVLDCGNIPEDGTGNFPGAANDPAKDMECKILCGAGGKWGFQYVPFLWQQLPDFSGGDGDFRGFGSPGFLWDCKVSV